MFLNIQRDWIILNTCDQQFTLTTKKSLHIIFNLLLHHKVQKFSSGTGSPGWSRKKGRKTVVVCGGGGGLTQYRKAVVTCITRRPASADRTARHQFQATGQPVSQTQASDAVTSRLPRYEAKCVQCWCFQCGSVPLRSDIKRTELPPASILIPLEKQAPCGLRGRK